MKLTTHILGLIVVFSVFSLIGCGNKDNQPTAAQIAAAREAGIQCGINQACRDAYMAAKGYTPDQIKMVDNTLGSGSTAPGILPPPAGGTTQVVSNTTGNPPAVLPNITKANRDQAARIQQAISDISKNPNSSYYVDPNAEDIPARPSPEQIAAATSAIRNSLRAPASVQNSQGDTNSTQ